MDRATGKLTPSDVTLLKRHPIREDVWDYDRGEYVNYYIGPRVGPSAPHGPNKKESKLLRRLCAETGRSPEEVREVPRYRWMLAKAHGGHSKWSSRRNDPYKGMTPEEKDRAQVAKKLYMTVDHPKFNMLYARELRWRKEEAKRKEEQAIIDKLSQPW